MAEAPMPQFRRKPALKMLIAELKSSTYQLPRNGDDQYESTYYLTPTGEIMSKVMVAGAAIEKEDIGDDQPFWRMRIADPTGAVAVFAGQYQAEATQIIAKMDIPCFVIVTGKPSVYEPENGNKVVSIRPESISLIGVDDKNSLLLDATEQLAERLKAPRNEERTKQIYEKFDLAALKKSAAQMLKDIIEPPTADTPTEAQAAAPPAQQPPEPQKPAEQKPAPEAPKGQKEAKGTKGTKGAAKKEQPAAPPAEEKKKEGTGAQSVSELIHEIVSAHPKGCAYQQLFDELKARGVGMMTDVEGAIGRLMHEGRLYEPKTGLLKAT